MPETPVAANQVQGQSARDEVLSKIDGLPSLSMVVTEFLDLAGREYFTAKDFERVIIKDQALVARLLKVANSTAFGAGRSIKTIPEAVVLVGLDNMKNMVYAVSSEGLMKQNLKNYRYCEKGFWLHAMGVGMTCRALTEAANEAELSGEEAFVSGLLHDTAKLLLDDFLEEGDGPRIVEVAEERQACGIDHGELAEIIMQKWNIPDPIVTAVRYHHEPVVDGEYSVGAAIVNLANELCYKWGVGIQQFLDLGEDVDPEEYSELLEAIGIQPDKLQQTLFQLRQKLVKLEDYYEED